MVHPLPHEVSSSVAVARQRGTE